MAITAAMRTQVAQLYTSLFGRAPEADGLGFWVQKLNNGETFASVAQQMYSVDAARAYYPSFYTNQEIIAKFYTNVLGRTADADGLAFWTAKLDAKGATPGSVIAEMINVVAGYSGTDPDALKSQALFNNKVSVGLHYAVDLIGNDVTFAKTLFTGVTDDPATVTAKNAVADAAVNPPPVGQTLTLTVSATDVSKGGGADDTIIGQLGQSTTLQASDNIDGGAGNDTLRVVTDGAAAASVGGFTTNNVETLEVQSQATGGTTLGLENATGLKTIRSSSSNQDLTVNNVKNLVTLDVVGSLNNQNITVGYQAAVVSGSSDTQSVTLNGNSLGTLTVNGVETLAASTATAASTIATLTGDKFAKVTVAGDKGFTVTNALPATVTSVDASAQTAGGITVTLTNAADVAVKGGAGNDSVTFTGALTSADSFDGGAGTDTITANTAEYTGSTYAVASKITNVEVLGFADQLSGTFDASKFTGENTYRLNGGFAAATTIDKADDNSTVNVRAASAGNTLTYNITNASDANTNNTVNIQVGGATNGVDAGTIAAAGVETVNLTSNGSAATVGGNTLTITDAAVTKLTIAGAEDLTLTLTGTALTTVDASAATGKLDLSAVTYKASTSATITGGAGADTIVGSAAADSIVGGAGNDVLQGGAGADTLTGGAGADSFVFNLASESSGSTVDTITDFVSGTDLLSLKNLAASTGRTTISLKNGAAADFGTAQSSVALNSGVTQVVFQKDTNTLWVDVNDDGTLNNNDLQIKLPGVTSIVAADIGGTATAGNNGNTIVVTGANANVSTTLQTNASALATANNDTIVVSIANLASLTANGAGGTADVLQLQDAGNVGAVPNTITNIETLAFATVGTTANTGASLTATSIKNVTGSSNADSLDVTNLAAGGAVSMGAGNDTLTAMTKAIVEGAGSTFVGGDGSDTMTFANGLGGAAASIDLSSVSGFETIDLGTFAAPGGATTLTAGKFASGVTTLAANVHTNAATLNANMTAAQLDALTAITANGGANGTFNIATSDTGAISVNLSDTTFTAANLDSFNFSASGANQVSITIGANQAAAALTYTAGTNSGDIINVVGDLGTATLATAAFEKVNFTAVQTAATLTNTVAQAVTASAGGTFVLGATTGGSFSGSGTAAFTVTGGSGVDTITFTNTVGNTVNGIAGGGLDVINLNATNAAADTINLSDGGAGVGLVAAADRLTVSGFAVANDIIKLDAAQTTAGTAAAAQPVLQVVASAGAFTANNTADVVVVNFDVGGATNVLGGVLDGAALLANVGAITIVAGDKGYLVAYDAGNAYIYSYTDGNANTSLTASEIALIGVINSVSVGALGAANFALGT